MTNLTLSLDEDLLYRARVRALELKTTVNAVVREYLESFAGKSPAHEAKDHFLRLANTAFASSGPEGRQWSRDELYER